MFMSRNSHDCLEICKDFLEIKFLHSKFVLSIIFAFVDLFTNNFPVEDIQ